jgi:hypothetical protein
MPTAKFFRLRRRASENESPTPDRLVNDREDKKNPESGSGRALILTLRPRPARACLVRVPRGALQRMNEKIPRWRVARLN